MVQPMDQSARSKRSVFTSVWASAATWVRVIGRPLLRMSGGFWIPLIFGDMPGVAPRTAISAKIFWSIGGGDLVSSCGQGFALSGVLAFAGYRTF